MHLQSGTERIKSVFRIFLATVLAFSLCGCKKIEPERLIILKTGSVSEITRSSCRVNATLYDVGGAEGIDQHGFCWSLTPDLADVADRVELGTKREKGNFDALIPRLAPGTRYHIWAFASGNGETVYGEPRTFDTQTITTPAVETSAIGNITSSSATAGGNVLDDGGAEVTARGLCWNVDPGPTVDHPRSEDGSGTGLFESLMTGLEPNTTYYVRAYATNQAGTGYGNERSFTSVEGITPPIVTTGPVEEITWNTAYGGGNVLSDGGSGITERGICWSTQSNPTLADDHLASGTGLGDFLIQMTGLSPETWYYVAAYAVNDAGTSYGEPVGFQTGPEPGPPVVVTYAVSGIEFTAASCGGEVTSDGGAPIVSKGLCWSTAPDPTLSDAYLEYGGGPEPFTMEISGLSHDTEYYVRAYATNGAGKTGYGTQRIFTTPFQCGAQLVDRRDGQTYFTVTIGEQCWMGENLNIGTMVSSSSGQGDNGIIEKYCYDNNAAHCNTYGGLYTWDEMMQYTEIEMSQGVCPDGWHIPSDLEWMILERSLGMPVADSQSAGWRGTDEGGKLKSGGTTFWNPPNTGATNESLFSALPSGMAYNNGSFAGMGEFAVFWTSTPILETQAWYRYLHTDESRIYRVDGYRPNTTPVRCIKD